MKFRTLTLTTLAASFMMTGPLLAADEMKKDGAMMKDGKMEKGDTMMKDGKMEKSDTMMKDGKMEKSDTMMKDDKMAKDAMMKDDKMKKELGSAADRGGGGHLYCVWSVKGGPAFRGASSQSGYSGDTVTTHPNGPPSRNIVRCKLADAASRVRCECTATRRAESRSEFGARKTMSWTKRDVLKMAVGVAVFAVADAGRAIAETIAKLVLSDEEWRKKLTDEQYYILREEGTERPYTSDLNDEKRAGTYHCAGCDLALFNSDTKFESGTGWPSFYDVIPERVGQRRITRSCFHARNIIAHAAVATKAMCSRTARSRPACAIATTDLP